MPVVLNATANDPAANSYLTVAEYMEYLETAYEPAEAAKALADGPNLIMATRTLNYLLAGRKRLLREDGMAWYITSQTWTGAPSTTTQALPWGRSGMYDLNGNAISELVIPQALKNATAELARQMKIGDRTLDNDAAVQGVTALRAGSVSLSFKQNIALLKTLPEIVLQLLVPSWLTDEVIESAFAAEFDVV